MPSYNFVLTYDGPELDLRQRVHIARMFQRALETTALLNYTVATEVNPEEEPTPGQDRELNIYDAGSPDNTEE